MTVRSTKASTPGSPSKTAAKTVKLAPKPPKAAAKEGEKLPGKNPTMPAAAGKPVKKGAAVAARPAKTSSPHSRTEAAAKAVELASTPTKTMANAAMVVAEEGVDAAVAIGESVKKKAPLAIPAVEALDPRSQSNTVAKVVELTSIPPKAIANEGMKLADEASTAMASASEAVKKDSAYAVDIYKVSATKILSSTGDVAKAASEVVTGVTELQQTIWTSMQRAVQAVVEMPVHFAACTSFGDLVETQRGIMRQGFSEWLNISQEILMANRRITDRAINALELR